ncbi:hypothetical protein PPL_06870 [Heterostelium album PN500]|uniref:EGF-like domain-containing protein n=1 Tax=Heterostelium pallidum (strain ATCC 26659 / Pp 5 / PN500) TaxID=670386 RepID=D3BDR8_HETP5|nr:hypothetical protein PPL_06870 [Heterostelium album PN500]EFA80049.1 hypothetical protein PPL_06870 [Heterostelium album PN500]|eukprot:XP_020432169.1 hypothetical protein PPL_06870 [Heterostelium album PN500]
MNGNYIVTIDPIIQTKGCNYSSMLQIAISEPFSGKSTNISFSYSQYQMFNTTNPSNVDVLPLESDIIVRPSSNNIQPLLSTIYNVISTVNSLFTYVVLNSLTQSFSIPTMIGYSSVTGFSKYLYQSPIQSGVYMTQELYSFKDVLPLTMRISPMKNITQILNKDLIVKTLTERIIDGNIYSSSDFTLGQSDSFKIKYNDQTVQFKFPLGFGKGTLKQYNHIFDYPFSVYTQSMTASPLYQSQSIKSKTYINPIPQVGKILDKTPPSLTSIIILGFSNYTYNIVVDAFDIESGIYSITISEDYDPRDEKTITLFESDLSKGTLWNGTFSKQVVQTGVNHDSSYSVVIESRSGLKSVYKSLSFIPNQIGYPIPAFPTGYFWTADDIINFISVNITNSTPVAIYTNKLYIKINKAYASALIPRIQLNILPPNLSKQRLILFGEYISSGAFQGLHEFTVPYIPFTSSFGDNIEGLILGDRDIPLNLLYIQFSAYTLRVSSSTDIIMMPPIFKSINIKSSELGLQFNVTFQCFGQVDCENTPGDYDPTPLELSFTGVTGYYQSQYVLSQTTTCRSQNYTVVSAYLTDGYRESDSEYPNLISPFLNIYQNSRTTFLKCSTATPDIIAPVLNSFSISQTTINAAIANTIKVRAIISDDRNFKYAPMLYYTSLHGYIDSVNQNDMTIETINDTCIDITYTLYIPKYWGSGNISLSLYGMTDGYDNFNGYSTYDLSKFNQSVIHRQYDGEPPNPTPSIPQEPTTSPLPCTNQCSNNGVCILNNQCKCNSGYFGPNCEGTSFAIPKPLPDPEEPRVISDPKSDINLEISIEELVEIDSLEVKWTLMTSNNNNTYKYSLPINNETNLYIQIDWSDQERIIQFAGLNITIAPHSLKYTISLDHYSFKIESQLSSIENCSSSIETSGDNNDLEWIKLQYNGKILYGRFVQIALVDGQPQKASTKLIESEEEGGSSYFGINIPFFVNTVVLDPDFSVLVTDQYNNCKDDTVLSTGAIIGIAVGGAVFVILSLSTFMILYNRTRRTKLLYKLRALRGSKSTKSVELQ